MNKIKIFLEANKLFFKIAWKKHKLYFVFYILSTIISFVNTMLSVVFPKLFLSAILEEKNFRLGIIYVLMIIFLSLGWAFVERKIIISQQVILKYILL